MQGRLLFVKWQYVGDSRYEVTARVKTQAGRRADVRIGTFEGLAGIEEGVAQANTRFPSEAQTRMEART